MKLAPPLFLLALLLPLPAAATGQFAHDPSSPLGATGPATYRGADATAQLGWRHYFGKGATQDHSQAFSLFRAAAGQGSLSGQYGMAVCLRSGAGVPKDAAAGDKLMLAVAEKGYADAQVGAGESAFQAGRREQARAWYEKAAAQDSASGARQLGFMLMYGHGGPADPARAIALLERSASQDDDDAMYYLAQAHEKGIGVAKDTVRAREWYVRSAGLGDSDAQLALGNLYAGGIGGERNVVEAMRLYRLAAEDANRDAIYALAVAYLEGDLVPEDLVEGARWLERGIALGDHGSMVRMGRHHLFGIDRPVNPAAAVELFSKVEAAGDPYGAYWMGYCREHGHGVARDEAMAVALYQRAAEAGMEAASSQVLLMTMEGRGIARDPAGVQARIDRELNGGNVTGMFDLAINLIKRRSVAEADALVQQVVDKAGARRDRLDFASALGRTGVAYQENQYYSRAETWLTESLKLLERHPKTTPGTLANGLDRLGALYKENGNAQRAEALFERAYRLRLDKLGADDLEISKSYSHLADVSIARDQFAKAEQYSRLNLALTEKVHGFNDRNTDDARADLAQILYFQGKYREAEPLFIWVLTAVQGRLGDDNPAQATKLNNLAFNHMALGNFALAEPAFRRALVFAERKSGGKPHHGVATALANLGGMLTAAGRHAEAESLIARSLVLREQLLGPMHYDVAMSLIRRGKLYVATGRHALADLDLARAREILGQHAKTERWEISGVMHQQGLSQRAQGKHAEARALLADAFAARLAIQPRHPETQETASALADVYRVLGEEGAASRVEQQVKAAGGS